jgi:hypothetical protein
MKAEALVLLLLVRAALHLISYPRLRACLRTCESLGSPSPRPVAEVTRAVSAAGRRLTGTTCLAEALVAYTMLRRRGHAPVLRIGVRESAPSLLEAHAWIECDGTVVVGQVPQMDGLDPRLAVPRTRRVPRRVAASVARPRTRRAHASEDCRD